MSLEYTYQKKQLKKQIQVLSLEVMVMSLCCIAISLYVLYGMLLGQPTIKLNKEPGQDGEYMVVGHFSFDNKINLWANPDYALSTVYHEYGHYIYFKKMSSNERKEWVKEYCGLIDDLDRPGNQCEEKFAVLFSGFMQNEAYSNKSRWYYDDKIRVFIDKAYQKYI